MTLLPLTAAAALAPSLLLMGYFHSRDLFREPPRVLWRVFGLGVLILLPAALVAWPFRLALGGIESPLLWGFAAAFLEAAVPEESFKFAVLWLYALRRREFDEPIDGVVYGVAASLGFATFENVLYVAGAGLGVAVLRAFTAVPAHAFLGALMGAWAARARLASAGGRGRWLFLALAVPTLLHGLYDFPLLAWERAAVGGASPDAAILGLAGLVPAIVLVEWVWAVRIVRRLRAEQDRLAAAAPGGAIAAGLPGLTSSVALVLGGAVLVCGAVFMGLAILAAVVTGEVASEDLGWAVAAAGVFAAAPAAAGCATFVWGIRRLNRRGRAGQCGGAAALDPLAAGGPGAGR